MRAQCCAWREGQGRVRMGTASMGARRVPRSILGEVSFLKIAVFDVVEHFKIAENARSTGELA